MQLRKPYYLFFDFDYTVYVNGTVSDATKNAMHHAQKEGHKLILCTGRSHGHLSNLPEIQAIPWDGEIWGGADIYYGGKCYETNTASFEDIEAWFDYADRHKYDLILEGQKRLDPFHFSKKDLTPLPEFPIDIETKPDLILPNEERLKKCFQENPVTKISILQSGLDANEFPKTNMTPVVHALYAEAFAAGCDKGIAIKHFCQHIGISIDQCACFGDSMNDAPMFRVCPVSICVKWAPKELVALSTYHAKTEESVAEGIQWLLNQ